jgi:hypothetical protein
MSTILSRVRNTKEGKEEPFTVRSATVLRFMVLIRALSRAWGYGYGTAKPILGELRERWYGQTYRDAVIAGNDYPLAAGTKAFMISV